MSQLLKFDQWAETEGANLEGLDLIKGYGDYYRYQSFAEGSFNQEASNDVDRRLFQLARKRGFVNEFHDDLAVDEFFEQKKPEGPTDRDIERVISHKFYSKEDKEGERTLRNFLATRNLAREEEVDEDLVKEREEQATPYLTPSNFIEAKRSSVLRGDVPFAIFDDEDGKTELRVDPNLRSMTNEEIVNFAKANPDLVSSRDLPVLRNLFDVPEGLTAPGHQVMQNSELRDVFADSDGVLSDDVKDQVSGVVTAVAGGYTGSALQAAQDLATNPGLLERYSSEQIVNAVLDHAKESTAGSEPIILSTGEVVMPMSTFINEAEHDAMVDGMDISDAQKELTKSVRRVKLANYTPHYHKLAVYNDRKDYLAFYEGKKMQGVSDTDIIEEWYNDDENYDGFGERAKGVFFGSLEGFAGIPLYAMAWKGNEDARKTMQGLLHQQSMQQEYSAMFGDKFGVGYTILRTAPSVAADIAMGVFSGGVLTAASVTGKAAMRLTLRESFRASTKRSLKKAMKEGGEGAASTALKKAGKDWAKTKAFTKGVFGRASLGLIPGTFNRAGGAAYVSTYSALESKYPDMTPGQLREAAMGHALIQGATTTGIVLAFQGLAQMAPKFFGAGAEQWAMPRSGGLTVKQLNRAYMHFKNAPGKIRKAGEHAGDSLRRHMDLRSFEAFLGKHVKEGMRNTLLAYGRQTWSEGLEEGIDQFVGAFLEANATNEKVNIIEAFNQAAHAFIVGGAFGFMGGVREVGVRSPGPPPESRKGARAERARQKFARRQRGIEQDVYLKYADSLEQSGNVESAAFLRMQANVAAQQRRTMSEQLEQFATFATREEARVETEVAQMEKLKFTPSQLQLKIERLEEMLSGEGGLESVPVDERTPQQMVTIVAARNLRDKYADIAAGKQLERRSPATAGVRGTGGVKAPIAIPAADGSGVVIGQDRGTGYVEPVAKVKNKEDAESRVEVIDRDLKRLGELGRRRTAYQNERLKTLSEEREAIRSKYPDTKTTEAEPAAKETAARETPEDPRLRLKSVNANLTRVGKEIDKLQAQIKARKEMGQAPSYEEKAALRQLKAALTRYRKERAKIAEVRVTAWAPFPLKKVPINTGADPFGLAPARVWGLGKGASPAAPKPTVEGVLEHTPKGTPITVVVEAAPPAAPPAAPEVARADLGAENIITFLQDDAPGGEDLLKLYPDLPETLIRVFKRGGVGELGKRIADLRKRVQEKIKAAEVGAVQGPLMDQALEDLRSRVPSFVGVEPATPADPFRGGLGRAAAAPSAAPPAAPAEDTEIKGVLVDAVMEDGQVKLKVEGVNADKGKLVTTPAFDEDGIPLWVRADEPLEGGAPENTFFDPVTNTLIRIEDYTSEQAAADLIEADRLKRERDAASLEKKASGGTLTPAEEESLSTGDPLDSISEELEEASDLEASGPLTGEDAVSPFPTQNLKLRAVIYLKSMARVRALEEERTRLTSDEDVEARAAEIEAQLEEELGEVPGLSVTYTPANSNRIFEAREDGVYYAEQYAKTIGHGMVKGAEASSLDEAMEIAARLAQEEADKNIPKGGEKGAKGVVEVEFHESSEEVERASRVGNDPSSASPPSSDEDAADEGSGSSSGRTTIGSRDLVEVIRSGGMLTPLERVIFQEYARARLLAEKKDTSVEEELDTEIKKTREGYGVGRHILPLWHAGDRETLVYANNSYWKIVPPEKGRGSRFRYDSKKHRVRKVTDTLIKTHSGLKGRKGQMVVMEVTNEALLEELAPIQKELDEIQDAGLALPRGETLSKEQQDRRAELQKKKRSVEQRIKGGPRTIREAPVKNQPNIVALNLNEATLEDADGVPRFLTPEDEQIFYELVEAGNVPRPEFIKNNLWDISSHHISYYVPFLNTVRKHVEERYPVAEVPEGALKRQDPDATLQRSVIYSYFVTTPTPSGRIDFNFAQLKRALDEVDALLAITDQEKREHAQWEAAEKEVIEAEAEAAALWEGDLSERRFTHDFDREQAIDAWEEIDRLEEELELKIAEAKNRASLFWRGRIKEGSELYAEFTDVKNFTTFSYRSQQEAYQDFLSTIVGTEEMAAVDPTGPTHLSPYELVLPLLETRRGTISKRITVEEGQKRARESRALTEEQYAEINRRLDKPVTDLTSYLEERKQQIQSEFGARPKPGDENLPPALKKIVAAKAKAKKVWDSIEKGDLSNKRLHQRRRQIIRLGYELENARSGETLEVKFDPRVAMTNKQQTRFRELHKGNQRGFRLGKSRKVSQSNKTKNLSIPFIRSEVTTGNFFYRYKGKYMGPVSHKTLDQEANQGRVDPKSEEPEISYEEVPLFTNEPAVVASAISAGFSVKVPRSMRDTVNPAIDIDDAGNVLSVLDPLTQKLVSAPGDLSNFVEGEVYAPNEIRNSLLQEFVTNLPSVPEDYFAVIGNTPDGTPGSEVVGVTRTRTDDLGRREKIFKSDDAYFVGAARYMDGHVGGSMRRRSHSRMKKVEAEAGKERDEAIQPLLEAIRELEGLVQAEKDVLQAGLGVPGGGTFRLQDIEETAKEELDEVKARYKEAKKEHQRVSKNWKERLKAPARIVQRAEAKVERLKRVFEEEEAITEGAGGEVGEVSPAAINEAETRKNMAGQELIDAESEKALAYQEYREAERKPEDVEDAEAALDEVALELAKAETSLESKKRANANLEKAREKLRQAREGDIDTEVSFASQIKDLQDGIKRANQRFNARIREETESVVTQEREIADQGRYKAKDVLELEDLALRTGGLPEDAREVVLTVYMREIREFGLAYRLLEMDRKGRSVESMIRFLKKELPDSSIDYIKSRHRSRKTTNSVDTKDFMRFLSGKFKPAPFGVHHPTIRAFRDLLSETDTPDQINEVRLRKFIDTSIDDVNVRKRAEEWVDSRSKATVTDDLALQNYVESLLDTISPDADETGRRPNTKWFHGGSETAQPRSLKTIIANVKKRYVDALKNKGAPQIDDINDAEGSVSATVEMELAESMTNLILDADEFIIDQGEIASPAFIKAAGEYIDSPVGRDAKDVLLKVLAQMDLSTRGVEDMNGEALWQHVMEQLTDDMVVNLPHQLRGQLASIIKVSYGGLSSMVTPPSSKAAARIASKENVETNWAAYNILLAKAQLRASMPAEIEQIQKKVTQLEKERQASPPQSRKREEIEAEMQKLKNRSNALTKQWHSSSVKIEEGLTPQNAKELFTYLSEDKNSPLSPESKGVLIGLMQSTQLATDVPSIKFIQGDRAMVAPYIGKYITPVSEGSEVKGGGTLVINLTKPDMSIVDTLLRGLIQHRLAVAESEMADPDTMEGSEFLKKDLAKLREVHKTIVAVNPDAGPLSVGSGIRFAMTDPTVRNRMKSRPSFQKKLTDLLARLLNLDPSNPIMRRRLQPFLKEDKIHSGMKAKRPARKKRGDKDISAIDLMQRMLPPGIRIQESTNHVNPAWVTTARPDTIYVNEEALERMVEGLGPRAKKMVVRALVGHEKVHIASLRELSDADRMAILAGMTDEELNQVRARTPEGAGPVELAEEYLRMKVEEVTFGMDSEAFVRSVLAHGAGIRGAIVRYVTKFLRNLRGVFSKGSIPLQTLVHIDNVASALASLERDGLPLEPLPKRDIGALRSAIEVDLDEGTERTFFAVPVISTDPDNDSWWARVRRNPRLKKEVRRIKNDIDGHKAKLEGTTRDFALKLQAAINRGAVFSEETINDALGSIDDYTTPEQNRMLEAARRADEAAGLDEETTKINHEARYIAAQQKTIRDREKRQTEAIQTLEAIDPELAKTVASFRDLISEESRKVGNIRGEGKIDAVWDARGNVHLIRSYEFFRSKAWATAIRKAKPGERIEGYEDVDFNQLRTDAITFIKEQHRVATGKEIDGKVAWGKLQKWLGKVAELEPSGMGDSSAFGTLAVETGMFEQRQEIPPEIMAVLGVETSNTRNAINTHLRLGTYLAKNEAMESLKGLLASTGVGFIRDTRKKLPNPDGKGEPIDNPNYEPATEEVGGRVYNLVRLFDNPHIKDSPDYAALKDLYVREEDKPLIEKELTAMLPFTGADADTFFDSFNTGLKRFFATSLGVKTLGGIPAFFTRNEGTNSIYLRPMQGDFGGILQFGGIGEALGALFGRRQPGISRVAAGGVGFAGMQFAAGEARTINVNGNAVPIAESNEQYTMELLQLGMIENDVTANLMKDIYRTGKPTHEVLEQVNNFIEGKETPSWFNKALSRFQKKNTGLTKLEGAAKYILTPLDPRRMNYSKGLGLEQTMTFLAGLNSAIDAKAKVGLFEMELATLYRMREELGSSETDMELKKKAANKVLRTMPGHSQLSPGWRKFTGSTLGMFIGVFARWKTEVVRTWSNTLPLVIEEFKEARATGSSVLMRRSMKRFAGFAFVNTAMSAVIVQVLKRIFQMFDDEEDRDKSFEELTGAKGELLKSGMPKWMEHHTVYASVNPETNTLTAYDLTFYNPLSPIHDPFKSAYNGFQTGGISKGTGNFLESFWKDVVGYGIGPQAAFQAIVGKDDYGERLYTPGEALHVNVGKGLNHYWEKALRPGVVDKIVKAVKANKWKDVAVEGDAAYDVGRLIAGEIIGVPPKQYELDVVIERAARNVKRDIDALYRDSYGKLYSPLPMTEEDVLESVLKLDRLEGEQYKRHIINRNALAELLGGDYRKANRMYISSMIAAGNSKARSNDLILRGRLDRRVIGAKGLETIRKRANQRGAEGGATRLRNLKKAYQQIPRYRRIEDY